MILDDIKYCPRCAALLIEAQRRGRLRPVCPACDWIFFPDPKVAAAVLVEQLGKVFERSSDSFESRLFGEYLVGIFGNCREKSHI